MYSFKRKLVAILVACAMLVVFAGCSGEPLSTREKGTGIGALVGAGTGAIIGAAVGAPGAGAAIGGALGAGTGFVVGNAMQNQENANAQTQSQIQSQQQQIEAAAAPDRAVEVAIRDRVVIRPPVIYSAGRPS